MKVRTRMGGWKRAALVLAGALVAPMAVALGGPTAPASAATIIPCQDRTTATPFRPWSDTRNYYLLQGGSFEYGNQGWDLYGQAGIGNGSSPWKVWGGGSRALWLGPGGTAVAPTFCASVAEPYVRFFYLASPEQNARLKVSLTIWRGTTQTTQQYWLPGGSGRWEVSQAIPIPDVYADGYRSLSVKFEAVNSSTAQWLIDDFSVDPWKSL
ncbi:MAG: hypothetical protein U0Q15_04890 [Kineosporiaceae bacterium]